MNIFLFNKNYWIRSFGEQKVVKGYLTSGFKDRVESLHIHPASNNTLQALPEGERTIKRLEGHGSAPLTASDEKTGVKGDMLLYYGDWYECISSQLYHTTLLSHYNYQFILVPKDGSRKDDIKNPPVSIPQKVGGGKT